MDLGNLAPKAGIKKRDELRGKGDLRYQDKSAPPPGSSKEQAADTQEFFNNKGNESFTRFLDALVDQMMEGKNVQGQMMRASFGGDQTKAKQAIKDEVVRALKSTEDDDQTLVGNCKMQLDRSGEVPVVKGYHPASTRTHLGQHIHRYVQREGSKTQ